MLFSKPKPKPSRAEALDELHKALRSAVADAHNFGVHSSEITRALENASQNYQMQVVCSTPVPSAAAASLYDAERLKIVDKPKPTPPRNARFG